MEGNVWINWHWYVFDTRFVDTLKALNFEEIGPYLDMAYFIQVQCFVNVNYATFHSVRV